MSSQFLFKVDTCFYISECNFTLKHLHEKLLNCFQIPKGQLYIRNHKGVQSVICHLRIYTLEIHTSRGGGRPRVTRAMALGVGLFSIIKNAQ
jgi:hypothetical protein